MTLPRDKQQVAIVVPPVGRMLGRVDKVNREGVSVTLDSGHKGKVSVLGSDEATLMFATASGVHSLAGKVRRSPIKPGSLRFYIGADSQLAQRREHVRVEAALVCVLFRLTRGGGRVQTHTCDVSGGGLAVLNTGGFDPGEEVGVSLDLGNDSQRMSMTCKVVRRTDVRTIGLVIERISTSERERLIQYIFVRQRTELKLGRKS